MESWNDLQLVESIARKGSLAAASRALELDYSTVYRRLNALEKRLGSRLFERSRSACIPTEAGQRLAAAAGVAREAVDAAMLDIAGGDSRLTGTIRVTTIASFAEQILMPIFAEFRQAYPAIRLELVESFALYNLTQREADVAIRFTTQPPENLIGRRLGKAASGIYASAEYLRRHRGLAQQQMDWIMPSGPSVTSKEADWHRRHVPAERISLWVNSGSAGCSAAQQHLGLVLLICYLGDRAGLVRISEPLPALAPDLWLLTHPNLRHVARIRVFLDFVRERLQVLRPLLEGERSVIEMRPLTSNAPAARRTT